MKNKKLIRFKNDVNPKVLDWMEKQGNATEAIVYLIEKEIFENGIRDMELYIPIKRADEYFENLLNKKPAEIKKETKAKAKPEKKEVEQEAPTHKNTILDSYAD
jgi:hypothetical protein